jgi:hypothetical protein
MISEMTFGQQFDKSQPKIANFSKIPIMKNYLKRFLTNGI